MISYTITACNEHEELDKLLNVIRINIKEGDEIVLQLDSENTTDEVREVVKKYEYVLPPLKVIEFLLNGDFASFKNNLKSHCTKEWIFNIDADEMPSGFLLENIRDILNHNKDIDLIIVPRWNTVNGITSRHINLWGWRNDDLGRINWPDWQMRIYRNKENIRWKNKVHERIEGYDKYAFLPEDKDYCLFHNKSIEKQESQNNFYNTIG
jgi:glycosyltransferase involved in cell wall biosynthesis